MSLIITEASKEGVKRMESFRVFPGHMVRVSGLIKASLLAGVRQDQRAKHTADRRGSHLN